MFENLIGQDLVRTRLIEEVRKRTLPRALLFYGGRYTGKQTAALEVARALACYKEAVWGCSCRACLAHKELSHPLTLLVGNRSLLSEIERIAQLVDERTEGDTPLLLLLTRAVRKWVRHFDPMLWRAETKKEKMVSKTLETIEEALETINLAGCDRNARAKGILHDLVSCCRHLAQGSGAALGVQHIRESLSWAKTLSPREAKTLIIDGAHDLSENAQNALLKFLEEPSSRVTTLLITTQPRRLLPTVRSRLRSYFFRERTPEEQKKILQEIFGYKSPCASLEKFFEEGSQETLSHTWEKWAEKFLVAAQNGHAYHTLAVGKRSREEISLLLRAIRRSLHDRLSKEEPGTGNFYHYCFWIKLVSDRYRINTTGNQSPALLLESLYYEMENKASL